MDTIKEKMNVECWKIMSNFAAEKKGNEWKMSILPTQLMTMCCL